MYRPPGARDAERVPIGQALLASTGEVMNTAMVDTDTGDTQDSDRGFARRLIRNMSGLGIAYPDSPLTVPGDEPGGGPRPGQRLTQISAADAQSPGWTALRAVLRAPAWHLLVVAGSDHAVRQDQVTVGPPSLPVWLDRITISRRRPDEEEHSVWDPDGRVQDTLAATDGDWILVRPDGYVSARGAGESSFRATMERVAGPDVLEPARA